MLLQVEKTGKSLKSRLLLRYPVFLIRYWSAYGPLKQYTKAVTFKSIYTPIYLYSYLSIYLKQVLCSDSGGSISKLPSFYLCMYTPIYLSTFLSIYLSYRYWSTYGSWKQYTKAVDLDHFEASLRLENAFTNRKTLAKL